VAGAVLAVALVLGATARLADEAWLLDAAVAVSLAGLVLIVLDRFGAVSRLSWLDAAMGATSIGALTFALGGPVATAIALGGVAGTALTLLAIGQFAHIGAAASALAIVTVLAGMARAGITVTERLHDSERRAHTDDLTGLANRRQLLDRLDAAIERGDDLALL